MRKRIWFTVIATTSTLLVASGAWNAWPTIAGLIEQAQSLPWSVLVLGAVSCGLWLICLVRLCRTWAARRYLVRLLARIGAPRYVIADTANLSQDGVELLVATTSGNRGTERREVFAGTGNEFMPFSPLREAGHELVTSAIADT